MKDLLQTIIAIIHDYLLFNSLVIKDLFGQSTPKDWETGDMGTVVLIPGFNEGLHFLKDIGNLLNEKGYRIIYPKKFGRFKSIEDSAIEIQQELDDKQITSFSIIGHSKGGLVGKLMMMNNLQSIEKLVTISTPWQGTYAGYLHILNLNEIKANSKVIQNLKDHPSNSKIVNIRSKFDQYMIGGLDFLEGAKNIKINTIGHVRSLLSAETKKVVQKEF